MVLLILLIFLGGWGWKQYIIYKMDRETDIEMILLGQSQYICDATKLIEVLQAKNIPVDKEYIDEIRKKEQFIIGNFQNIGSTLDINTWGTILYLNEYYEEGMLEKILQQLDSYYIKESKLFTMLPIDKEENVDTKKDELQNVQLTQMFLETLGEKKTVVSKYRLEEGLIIWFNQNVGNASNEQIKSTLQEVFWYFYNCDKLDKLNYKKAKDIIKSDVDSVKKYIKEEQESNITKALCIEEVDRYMQLFEGDDSYQGKAEETFNQIRTLEQLEYIKTDKSCLFFLTDFLKTIDTPKNIDFLKEVINDCLKENFYASCKDA